MDTSDIVRVQQVMAEYCLRLELSPFEEWLDLFTDDCVFEVFGRTLHGREQVAAMLSQAPHGIHMAGTPHVEVDGDTASSVQNYIFVDGSTRELNMGWYHDRLTKGPEGRWRIAHHRIAFYK